MILSLSHEADEFHAVDVLCTNKGATRYRYYRCKYKQLFNYSGIANLYPTTTQTPAPQ